MTELTISEVARRAGIRASAIRYYESINLIPPARRAGGQRRYDPDILRRLSFIHSAQALGFTIAEIQTFFKSEQEDTSLGERWQTLAQRKLEEIDALLKRAQYMKQVLEHGLKCNCPTIDECMDCVLCLYQRGNVQEIPMSGKGNTKK